MRAEASCCAGYLSAVTAPELAGICGRLRSGAAPVPGQLVVFEQLVFITHGSLAAGGEGERRLGSARAGRTVDSGSEVTAQSEGSDDTVQGGFGGQS